MVSDLIVIYLIYFTTEFCFSSISLYVLGMGRTDIFVATHVYGYKCLELMSEITFNCSCLDTLFIDKEFFNQTKYHQYG